MKNPIKLNHDLKGTPNFSSDNTSYANWFKKTAAALMVILVDD